MPNGRHIPRDRSFRNPIRAQARDRLYYDLVQVLKQHRGCCDRDKRYILNLLKTKILNEEDF